MEKMYESLNELHKAASYAAGQGGQDNPFVKMVCLLDIMVGEISSLKTISRIPTPFPLFEPTILPACQLTGSPNPVSEPMDKKKPYQPQSKEEQDIYDHLLTTGCSRNEAASIAKEMMNLASAGGEE
jgi:hypothetical protein